MFPKTIKKHNMETIKQGIYKVEHANTEIYGNFAIIYLHNILNEYETEMKITKL